MLRFFDPLFFLHTGDFHYADIDKNDKDLYRAANERILTPPRHAEFFRKVPLVYMWDDHDYGPNDSDKSNPGREAARLTDQEYFPHYPLAAGVGNVPIYQAFTVGRVRFIMTDLRSERSVTRSPDGPDKTMMGKPQKAWFKSELIKAKDTHALIVWVSSVTWQYRTGEHPDRWGGYHHERREIADFIKKNGIRNICILAGDHHALALDDGSNSDYATGGGAPIPNFVAGSLSSKGYLKGGTFSHGGYSGNLQFGIMRVTDNGGETVGIEWIGIRYSNMLPGKAPFEAVVKYKFTVPVPAKEAEPTGNR